MSYFTVISIGPDEVEQSYALVRTIAPDVPPDLWAAFVTSCREPGDMLGLRTPDGAIFGMASFRIEECTRLGRVMLVDNFVTAELSRAAPGRALLTSTLEQTAETQRCSELRQVTACEGWLAMEGATLRNHLCLIDTLGGKRFSKGPVCSCSNLRSLSTIEMYPAR
jgi:hypothetical protein